MNLFQIPFHIFQTNIKARVKPQPRDCQLEYKVNNEVYTTRATIESKDSKKLLSPNPKIFSLLPFCFFCFRQISKFTETDSIDKQNNFLSPMADHTESPRSYLIFIKIMSKRRTWVCLFIAVYAILLSSSWNLLRSVLNWYKLQYTSSSSDSSPSPSPSRLPAVYASVVLGAMFGAMSMVAATTVAVPAVMVIWISVVVLLAFFGKSRRVLVVEGRKITREVVGFVFKVLLKEGNVVAVFCAVLAYFLLIRRDLDSN